MNIEQAKKIVISVINDTLEKKVEVTKEFETKEAQTIAEETIAEWEYVNEITVSSFDANGKLVIE